MTIIQTVIRIILSIVLIAFIYMETGPATTIFAALILAFVEYMTFAMKKLFRALKGIKA